MTDGAGNCPHSGTNAAIDFTMADPAILSIGGPHEYYRKLRDNDRVHYDAKLHSWLVSRYEDVEEVLRDAITFSQEEGWKAQFAQGYLDELKTILERDGGGWFPEVLLLDPPGHTRIRKLLNQAFGAHRIRQLEPRIGALISEWVGRIAERGEADGMNDFAMPLTIDIMCEQLGFPKDEAAPKIQHWARAYIDQVSGLQTRDEMIVNAALIAELQHFIIDRVHEREKNRSEDMISDLVYAVLEDDDEARLTFAETVALTRGLLLAGNDTTATALSNFLLLMATRPDLAEHVYRNLDDNREMSRFVEELLRLKPPVRALFRMTTREVELGGVTLPKGANVAIMFASANDDETVFSCPRDFDPSRPNVVRHLAFGGGIHLCAGISLARMEIKSTIREVMSRLKNIRLTIPEDELRYTPSLSSMPLERLPIRFDLR